MCAVGHRGVDSDGLGAGMAEQALDEANVGAAFEQVGGVGVAQQVPQLCSGGFYQHRLRSQQMFGRSRYGYVLGQAVHKHRCQQNDTQHDRRHQSNAGKEPSGKGGSEYPKHV